jgi:hypothetical protein
MFRLCHLISLVLVLLFTDRVHSQGFVPAAKWHEARPAKRFNSVKGGQAALAVMRMGELVNVGKVPPEFSHQFDWDRKSDEIRLAVYVNAGDPYGVCISNLKKGDTIQVTSARGNCRFSRGDAAKHIASFLVVASTVAALVIEPELAPTVEQATRFAKDNLVPSGRGLMRDPFGFDSGTGDYCSDEGGILICFPSAGGIYHMQGGGHVRGSPRNPRTDNNRPPHIGNNGFFLVRNTKGELDQAHNTRTLDRDGEVFLLAWDWADSYNDNTGYYEVRMTVKKGK